MGIITLDRDTERLAERLADVRGLSVEAVVRNAIKESALHSGIEDHPRPGRTPSEKIARIRAITEEIALLPILDARTPDEIIGYNEYGVPE